MGGGSLSYNRNNGLGVAEGTTNTHCDVSAQQLDSFADGTSNSVLAPASSDGQNCAYLFTVGFEFVSGVVWGAADTSSYQMITANGGPTGTIVGPPGEETTCTFMPDGAGGKVTAAPASFTLISIFGATRTQQIKMTNTSPANCFPVMTMAPVNDGTCSLNLVGPPPFFSLEGNTPATVAANVTCTCGVSVFDSVSSTLTVNPTGCPQVPNVISITATCRNFRLPS